MSYPILAPRDTWFTQGGTTIKRNTITEINIKDSYTPAGAVTAQWDGSAAKDGSITVYIEGTKLTIAGNGSGKISANADSQAVFSQSPARGNFFTKVTAINGLNLLDTSNATTFQTMFAHMTSLLSLDVSGFDTSKVTSMRFMFGGHQSLGNTALRHITGLEKFDTSKVTTFRQLFHYCRNLAEEDIRKVENWDVSKAEDFTGMFYNTGVTTLDLSKWNTASFKIANHMFTDCSNLANLNMSGWDTSKVIDFGAFLNDCSSLTSIDVSGFNTGNCLAFSQMFERCSSATEIIGLEEFDTSKAGSVAVEGQAAFTEMFMGCSKLKRLNLANFDTSHAYDLSNRAMRDMFSGMAALEEIKLGPNFSRTAGSADPTVVPPLPTPTVPGWDGNWYTANRTAYAPADIPNNTAQTYYATKSLADASPNLVQSGTISNIGDAIREKDGSAAKISPLDMPEKIRSIQTGVDTSDATATAADIMHNTIAYIASGKVTGAFTLDTELTAQDTKIAAIKEALRTKGTHPSVKPVIKPLSVTSNGTYNVPAGTDGYNPVQVNVPSTSAPVELCDVSVICDSAAFGKSYIAETETRGHYIYGVISTQTPNTYTIKNVIVGTAVVFVRGNSEFLDSVKNFHVIFDGSDYGMLAGYPETAGNATITTYRWA